MAVGRIRNSGSLAALAAGLALLVLPAGAWAQDRGRGQWSSGGNRDAGTQGNGGKAGTQSSGNGGGRQGNGGVAHGIRGDQSPPRPATAPQAQAQTQSQHNWPRGDGNGRSGHWNSDPNGASARGNRFIPGRRPSPVEGQQGPKPSAPRVTEGHNWQGDGAAGQWQDRNRSYVDPNRSPAMHDPSRDRDRRGKDNNGAGWSNNGNGWQNGHRADRQSYSGGSYRNWNRSWRGDSRYDWRAYRASHRPNYRPGPYYAPYGGYSYHRLVAGFYLDTLFFGSNYWINDPWSYRLPPVYGPYRWVRYYDDALLVDTDTGEVVDVIYDFFW
jgi:hypothetical protein